MSHAADNNPHTGATRYDSVRMQKYQQWLSGYGMQIGLSEQLRKGKRKSFT